MDDVASAVGLLLPPGLAIIARCSCQLDTLAMPRVLDMFAGNLTLIWAIPQVP
jgi:hypothetical protein